MERLPSSPSVRTMSRHALEVTSKRREWRPDTGLLLAAFPLALAAAPLGAQTADDTNRIIDEGMNRSLALETAQHIADEIGPRLSNSPAMRRAEQWAIDTFDNWQLANVRREGFEFGRGWELISSEVRMVSPRPITLTAIPVAWTPPTDGTLTAEIIVAPISKEEHFRTYRGKLAGKIVLISLPGEGSESDTSQFQRFTNGELGQFDRYEQPNFDPDAQNRRLERFKYGEKLDAFLADEGALAWARISRRDGKLLHGEGYTHRVGLTPRLPGIEIAAEDYRRLARLARIAEEGGKPPVLAVNSNVRFIDTDTKAYNIIAEIPGGDPRAGYVMAGAHFDSWIAGDGAADNGAGSAVVMEAARILKVLGLRPRRTIRFVLWAAEEQGVFGSLAYVDRHLATRAGTQNNTNDPANYYSRPFRFPIEPKPGYRDLKAYFNVDNGSGKFRGIYAEGNLAAVPLLKKWLAPFAAMDAHRVVAAPTGGTDHIVLQAIGLPGFQFIQDPLDFDSRLHHTNLDTYDHLQAEDLRQASVVLAGVLWSAANDPETLPRQPLPTEPKPTDPFKYQNSSEE